MIRALAFFALLCGCLFIFGFLMAERVRISVRPIKGRPDVDVVVTVFNITPEMDTLFLEVCSAEMPEEGSMFCRDDGWYTNSAHPVRSDQSQYPFPLRNVPRGWLMLSAVVVDRDRKTVASGQTRVIR